MEVIIDVTLLVVRGMDDFFTDTSFPWKKIKDSSFLVTGANGLIGSALVRVLKAANERYGLNLKIIPHTRQTHGDIRDKLRVEYLPDYIFHCASITDSSTMVKDPVEVMSVAIDGTRNVLELARDSGSKSVVFLSSMEVYGQTEKRELCEEDLGFIDLTNPRSSYSES